ncbi:MAG: VOC family protein [Candidatus Krumholzibacteriia bacterium]
MKKLTPVLIVESIEPCLDFWVDRLGFEVTVKVPEGEHLAFVILARDRVEVMLQSRASVEKDVPALAKDSYRSALFVEVENLESIQKALEGVEHVFEERKTFYGATEICVRDPGGNVVTFAQFSKE